MQRLDCFRCLSVMLICRKMEIMEYFSIKIKFSVDTCYSRTLLY